MTASDRILDIAIIGSGIAGLAAAHAARDAGLTCMILDKGRRVGGRVSTKRTGGFTFNHGAQFLTARAPAFVSAAEKAIAQAALARWHVAGRDALAGQPTMRDFPDFLQQGLTVRQQTEIAMIRHDQDSICLIDKEGEMVSARQVIITAPAPQAAQLLQTAAPDLAALAATASYSPCWTAIYGFDTAPPAHDPAPVGDSDGPVGWALWEADRPGGDPSNHALTVQAAPGWSMAHLEDDAADVARALLLAWQDASGQTVGTPLLAAAHRWRYARVVTPAAADAPVISPCGRLAVAGDWLGGARIENAFLSGARATEALAAARHSL
ncbi:MAG: NAD(P)/FAD-dependent oxidoreductase [Candidatus Puniceispirillaceae bacterium]